MRGKKHKKKKKNSMNTVHLERGTKLMYLISFLIVYFRQAHTTLKLIHSLRYKMKNPISTHLYKLEKNKEVG